MPLGLGRRDVQRLQPEAMKQLATAMTPECHHEQALERRQRPIAFAAVEYFIRSTSRAFHGRDLPAGRCNAGKTNAGETLAGNQLRCKVRIPSQRV
jgi:hypothetical protein